MTHNTNNEAELRNNLQDILSEEITKCSKDKIKKYVEDIIYEIQSDIDYRLESDLAVNLSFYVQDMAKSAIEAMLSGNEERFRSYLHCTKNGWTGRGGKHSVIHGKLFETGAIELRKQIVNAHAETLKDERILDLEDQIKSLVKQNNNLEDRINTLIRDLNSRI